MAQFFHEGFIMKTNYKILIIDDEKDLCVMLKSFLERQSYVTEFAHTIKDGLSLVAAFQPNLVFLDNNLPDGFGINHIGTIKSTAKGTKVVVISAMTPSRDESLKNGVNAFVEKPISMAKIKNILLEVQTA
jgi:DNA-binding response OmpR family regulator